MTSFNFQSLFFALLVLVFVLVGQPSGGGDDFGRETSSEITSASLTVDAAAAPDGSEPESALASAAGVVAAEASATPRARSVVLAHPEPLHAAGDPPSLSAKAALVIELGSSAPLFARSADDQWPLASLTKLMTAVVALETFDPGVSVPVGERAIAADGEAGSFRAGELFTARDLVTAMLTISSNDAAIALAESYGYEPFLERMRKRAFALGMYQTSFADPAGLSVLNQSTPADFAKLAAYLLNEHPDVLELTRTPQTAVTELRSGAVRKLSSNNRLAGTAGFLGGKTGYTSDARENLLSIFERGGRQFLIIVFGSTDRFGETEKLYRWALGGSGGF